MKLAFKINGKTIKGEYREPLNNNRN